MRTVFLALLTLVWSSVSASAGPLDISYTHNTTFAVPEQSYQEARLWFLPDYQDSTFSKRTDTAPSGSGDRNDADYTCEKTYNLNASCTAPQIVEKVHNMGKTVCYKCKCPDNYKTTSCKTGWHLSGTPCKIGTTSYYTGCAVDPCPSGYTAGKTCGSGYTLEKSGQSGDQYCGKCVAKSCPSGYSAGLSNCNGKAYPSGWTYASNGYSGDSICGKCTAKTCSSGTAGLSNCSGKAHPEGWTYSSSGYAGDNVCGTCTAKSCPAGYTAGTTQCSNTTSWTYGSNGYAGDSICGKCTEKGCAEGFTKGLANCNAKAHPAGWSYSTGTPSGSTVCGKCTAKTCTSGTTSCSTGYVGEANGYYSGDSACLTCKVACTPTCPTGWSLTAPTNCKYGGTVTTADSAGCGSTCYRCEAMVATSCQQVIDHANSKYPGKIVLEGYYSCGDKTITLADGQSLVGKSYYTGATESATSKSAGLTFTTKSSTSKKNLSIGGNNTLIANLKLKAVNTYGEHWILYLGKYADSIVKDVYIEIDSQNLTGYSVYHTAGIYLESDAASVYLKGNVYISNVDDNPSSPKSRYNQGIRVGGTPHQALNWSSIYLEDGSVVNINLIGNSTDTAIRGGNIYMTGNARLITHTNGWAMSQDWGDTRLTMRGTSSIEATSDISGAGNGTIYGADMYDSAKIKIDIYGSTYGGLYGYGLGMGEFNLNSANNSITVNQINGATQGYGMFFTYLSCKPGAQLNIKGTTYKCVRELVTPIEADKGDIPPSPWFTKNGASQSCQPSYPISGSCPANGTCLSCPINSNYKRLVSCPDGFKMNNRAEHNKTNTYCIQTCLYNKTYQPTDYSCQSCTRNEVTYYGGTCYKDCNKVQAQEQMKCYQMLQQTNDQYQFQQCMTKMQEILAQCSQDKINW